MSDVLPERKFGWAPDDIEIVNGEEEEETVEARAQTVGNPRVGHRQPLPHEIRAAVDYEAMQIAWQEATESLVDEWAAIKAVQVDALADAVEVAVASGNPAALATVAAPVMGADVIEARMMAVLEDGITAARAEAAAQGITIPLINVEDLRPMVAARAGATSVLLSRSLSEAAARQALARYGVDNLNAEDVAAGVRTHLDELSDAYLNDQLGGALTQAQNTGRRAVIAQHPAQVYASELLDQNTCSNCSGIDGTKFESLMDAERRYPTGGFSECLGGPRCRGTLVAIYAEEAEPTIGEET